MAYFAQFAVFKVSLNFWIFETIKYENFVAIFGCFLLVCYDYKDSDLNRLLDYC